MIPEYIVLESLGFLVAFFKGFYINSIRKKMTFKSRPVTTTMDIASVALRSKILQRIPEFGRADATTNEMTNVQTATTKIPIRAGITILSMTFDDYLTGKFP